MILGLESRLLWRFRVCREPVWTEDGGFITVTFRRPDRDGKNDGKNDGENLRHSVIGRFCRIMVGSVRTMTGNKYVDNGQNEKEHHSGGR